MIPGNKIHEGFNIDAARSGIFDILELYDRSRKVDVLVTSIDRLNVHLSNTVRNVRYTVTSARATQHSLG